MTEDKQVRLPEKKELSENRSQPTFVIYMSIIWCVLLGLLSWLLFDDIKQVLNEHNYFVFLQTGSATSDTKNWFTYLALSILWVFTVYFLTVFRAHTDVSVQEKTSPMGLWFFLNILWCLFAWVGLGFPVSKVFVSIAAPVLLGLLLYIGLFIPYWFTGSLEHMHTTKGHIKAHIPSIVAFVACIPLWMRFGTELYILAPCVCLGLGIAFIFSKAGRSLRKTPLLWIGWLVVTLGPSLLTPYNLLNAGRLVGNDNRLLLSTIQYDWRLSYKRKRYLASPRAFEKAVRPQAHALVLRLWAQKPHTRIHASVLAGLSKGQSRNELSDFLKQRPGLHDLYTDMIVKSVLKNRSQLMWIDDVFCPAYQELPKKRKKIEQALMRIALLSRIPDKRWTNSFMYASDGERKALHLRALKDVLEESTNGEPSYHLQNTIKKCTGKSELTVFGKDYLTKPRYSAEEKVFAWLFWLNTFYNASSRFYSKYGEASKFIARHKKQISSFFKAQLQGSKPRKKASYAAIVLRICLSDNKTQKAFCKELIEETTALKVKEIPQTADKEVRYLLLMYAFLKAPSIKEKQDIHNRLKKMTPKAWRSFFETFSKRYKEQLTASSPTP